MTTGTLHREFARLAPIFREGRMNLDDQVCLCFHVTRRKLVNWVRIHEPVVASQLSECGGAGTGCGWCVPFLKQIFRQNEVEGLTAEEYAQRRAEYVKAGKGTPPAGSEV